MYEPDLAFQNITHQVGPIRASEHLGPFVATMGKGNFLEFLKEQDLNLLKEVLFPLHVKSTLEGRQNREKRLRNGDRFLRASPECLNLVMPEISPIS